MQTPNDLSRRNFLTICAAAMPAVIAPPMSINAAEAEFPKSEFAGKRKHSVGLELYSVRGELAKDLPNTLKIVSKLGYEVVEFYAPYFGWKPAYAKRVRAQMDDLGLRCYSTHNSF